MLLPGHAPDSPVPQKVHEGYDWIYVLSGRVRLAIGDEEIHLGPGEAAEFDTRRPHGFVSASMQPAEVINLFSRQGERVHVHGHGRTALSRLLANWQLALSAKICPNVWLRQRAAPMGLTAHS